MAKVLVVSDNINGFFASSICNGLDNKGINTINTAFEDEALQELIPDSKIIFILVNDTFDVHSLTFKSFKKKYGDSDKKIILYGNMEKVAEVRAVLPEDRIISELIRPMENDDVIEGVVEALYRLDNEGNKKCILVVDDSGPMLRTVLEWLEDKYDVELANSAGTASIKIAKRMPDLILLDYEMPVCSGPKFLRQLRDDYKTKDIPVIFLTAKSDSDAVKAVLSLKPQGYILKSQSRAQAVAKIDEFFANQK